MWEWEWEHETRAEVWVRALGSATDAGSLAGEGTEVGPWEVMAEARAQETRPPGEHGRER